MKIIYKWAIFHDELLNNQRVDLKCLVNSSEHDV